MLVLTATEPHTEQVAKMLRQALWHCGLIRHLNVSIPYWRVGWSSSCSAPNPVSCWYISGSNGRCLKHWYPCHPCGRQSSRQVSSTSARPRSGCCVCLRSDSVDGIALSLSLSLPDFSFPFPVALPFKYIFFKKWQTWQILMFNTSSLGITNVP